MFLGDEDAALGQRCSTACLSGDACVSSRPDTEHAADATDERQTRQGHRDIFTGIWIWLRSATRTARCSLVSPTDQQF
ncbi:hypothetical protein TRIATDRAFT_298640 [Trichoderma atroviride IMI 206040]|uniref:Uncharacterized protein n=1 Tax=Hypocrea atroviridis (strain ATCC 20476 / IMI 206040) TaxID=452589 RepID=G9NNC2_HYPAI|nr:uncharacterized protein TRIATDRAFT_298640 [Trichoderma atroviride IMI 206040]EHK47571.1 hypothetical protein TRIATDRAFT_298640 [Trichoderma atroviride IMI 206040]